MRSLLVLSAVASIALFAFAGEGLADPPELLTSPPPHQHFVVTPTGKMVAVGPDICEGAKQLAFNQFHYNVHGSEVRGVPVPTLGPQGGAPGLHNTVGAEFTFVRGC